jgi:hypothetical protein
VAVFRHVDPVAKFLGQSLVGAFALVFEDVGHGDQLDGPAGSHHGIGHRPAPKRPATDDGQTDGVVLGRVDVRDHRTG